MDDSLMFEVAPAATATVVLPIGLTDADGTTTHREASLRKLRGSDEALFYDTSLSGAQLVTELLRSCVARIGTVSPVQAAHLEQLYSVDRNFLLFALRRITFGDEWLAVYDCPACGTAVRVSEDLSEFSVLSLDHDASRSVRVELEDGYQDRGGVVHKSVVMRLPRGADESVVSMLAESDLWQARDALLVRCIEQFGTLPRAALESFGVKIVRELTLGDRRRIQRALDDGTPGVDFKRTVRCSNCALDFDAIADVTDFFGVS
jgi:hypothetical protein